MIVKLCAAVTLPTGIDPKSCDPGLMPIEIDGAVACPWQISMLSPIMGERVTARFFWPKTPTAPGAKVTVAVIVCMGERVAGKGVLNDVTVNGPLFAMALIVRQSVPSLQRVNIRVDGALGQPPMTTFGKF